MRRSGRRPRSPGCPPRARGRHLSVLGAQARCWEPGVRAPSSRPCRSPCSDARPCRHPSPPRARAPEPPSSSGGLVPADDHADVSLRSDLCSLIPMSGRVVAGRWAANAHRPAGVRGADLVRGATPQGVPRGAACSNVAALLRTRARIARRPPGCVPAASKVPMLAAVPTAQRCDAPGAHPAANQIEPLSRAPDLGPDLKVQESFPLTSPQVKALSCASGAWREGRPEMTGSRYW